MAIKHFCKFICLVLTISLANPAQAEGWRDYFKGAYSLISKYQKQIAAAVTAISLWAYAKGWFGPKKNEIKETTTPEINIEKKQEPKILTIEGIPFTANPNSAYPLERVKAVAEYISKIKKITQKIDIKKIEKIIPLNAKKTHSQLLFGTLISQLQHTNIKYPNTWNEYEVNLKELHQVADQKDRLPIKVINILYPTIEEINAAVKLHNQRIEQLENPLITESKQELQRQEIAKEREEIKKEVEQKRIQKEETGEAYGLPNKTYEEVFNEAKELINNQPFKTLQEVKNSNLYKGIIGEIDRLSKITHKTDKETTKLENFEKLPQAIEEKYKELQKKQDQEKKPELINPQEVRKEEQKNEPTKNKLLNNQTIVQDFFDKVVKEQNGKYELETNRSIITQYFGTYDSGTVTLRDDFKNALASMQEMIKPALEKNEYDYPEEGNIYYRDMKIINQAILQALATPIGDLKESGAYDLEQILKTASAEIANKIIIPVQKYNASRVKQEEHYGLSNIVALDQNLRDYLLENSISEFNNTFKGLKKQWDNKEQQGNNKKLGNELITQLNELKKTIEKAQVGLQSINVGSPDQIENIVINIKSIWSNNDTKAINKYQYYDHLGIKRNNLDEYANIDFNLIQQKINEKENDIFDVDIKNIRKFLGSVIGKKIYDALLSDYKNGNNEKLNTTIKTILDENMKRKEKRTNEYQNLIQELNKLITSIKNYLNMIPEGKNNLIDVFFNDDNNK